MSGAPLESTSIVVPFLYDLNGRILKCTMKDGPRTPFFNKVNSILAQFYSQNLQMECTLAAAIHEILRIE